MRYSVCRYTLLSIVTASQIGCSSWHNKNHTLLKPADYAGYAEAVFRRQNQATSQIMVRSLDIDAVDQAQINLLSAEKLMRDACEILNNYANNSQAGNSINLLLRGRMLTAVNTCDQATQRVEKLLSQNTNP